jgi:hypothetical protein
MANPTLLDIAKKNGSDAVVGLIDETSQASPEIRMGAARTIKGMNYKTIVRVTNPTVGFRNANEGTAATKGTYVNRLVETFIMNPRWECDKAVADRDEDGADAYIAMEADAIMEAAFQKLAAVFYYGTGAGGDAKGFPGLLQAYDATNMVVDAGGTTATTGSSVWAVRFGAKHVQWVWGADGSLDLSDVTEQRILDADSNPFTAYVQELLAYPGLQVGSIRSIGRIKKLTEDNGKGLTDALIADLLSKFPTGTVPDVLFANRRSVKQLRASRTATNATGAPAPFPTEAFGIPIAVTDAILSTEALTL